MRDEAHTRSLIMTRERGGVSNKIPPPPGDAEYRKAQGLPPNSDNG